MMFGTCLEHVCPADKIHKTWSELSHTIWSKHLIISVDYPHFQHLYLGISKGQN